MNLDMTSVLLMLYLNLKVFDTRKLMWLFAFEGVVAGAYWRVGEGCVVAVGRGSRSADDGSCYTTVTRDLDVPETTFACPI